ncbi:MAG TPA: hypothetical protein PLC40_18210, partial [Candidatus Hydrogenedentes bacterium]|nr:hypothetical protein [Candidatus Hydrogenedentota bacterium]
GRFAGHSKEHKRVSLVRMLDDRCAKESTPQRALAIGERSNIKENKIPSYFIYPLSPRITGGRTWVLITL